MVCGGLRWFVVVCGGLWWIAVVCLLVIPAVSEVSGSRHYWLTLLLALGPPIITKSL